MKNLKFDFKDITIVPETVSTITSRKEVYPYDEFIYVPVMVSPMDTVVDYETQDTFVNSNLRVCVPRGITPKHNDTFLSMSKDLRKTLFL
ncbi:MAG: hypothetical protein EBS55_13945, partial [Flavobacteriaceae bacterium]|nr:hypothetical protein [Flavobacteriaceae bacterium]